jgi:septum formation protein
MRGRVGVAESAKRVFYYGAPMNASELGHTSREAVADSPLPRLILASASPRRQQLLSEAGYRFMVHPADIDEESYPATLMPVDLARRLAFEKARVIAERFPGDVVLAADTVVAFGDEPLGKPADAAEARRMLGLLSGTTHVVITGVSIIRRAQRIEITRSAMSAVRMRRLEPHEINAYVGSREWIGKAGGYGIQDRDPFVTKLSGSHSNIVGLPMELTARMLESVGIYPQR